MNFSFDLKPNMAGAAGTSSSGKEPADPAASSTCSYDKSHQVSITRYLWHVHKCREKFEGKANDGSGEELSVCKFNAEHHCLVSEMKRHEEHCPDQYDMLRFEMAHNTPSEKMPNYTGTPKLTADAPNDYEWEPEAYVPPEDPIESNEETQEDKEDQVESDEESLIPLVYDSG